MNSIVIDSGFGGIAEALKLKAKKHKVTLIEKHIVGYFIAIYFFNNYNELKDSIYKIIFIGLASLTFPHILFEYLLEKNGK